MKMEDVARLAVIEQDIRDTNKFCELLHDLLECIYLILENPDDYEFRIVNYISMKKAMVYESFCDYLKYIGFQPVQGQYMYPKEQALSKLRVAQAAIKRKISICYGSLVKHPATWSSKYKRPNKTKFTNVTLKFQNSFLQKIQYLFNDVLKYEDLELQNLARKQIPLITLELKAIERVRMHQRKLKTGEIKGNDLSYEISLLMELLVWFKYKFFSWVDKPDCELCGGPTVLQNNGFITTKTETCRLESYKCTRCPEGGASFARHNDVATLLRTRRGRCGEWANCFALFCRALGYDTRYVYDTTDHVWCEVLDYDTKAWLHVDPCECLLDAPLTYSCGWSKRLSYVIAVSRDDCQDVTWRYVTDFKEVLKRRNLCGEGELIAGLMALREARQTQVSNARRHYLTTRCLRELVQLMVERRPSDYETHGRISGSAEWRTQRGEIGTERKSYTFEFSQPGSYAIEYYTGADEYRVKHGESVVETISTWVAGTFEREHIFRKIEKDWRQVYLAREEGAMTGSISWKISVSGDNLSFEQLTVRLSSTLYENGSIDCTIHFDNEPPKKIKLEDKIWQFRQKFKQVVVKCSLSGGKGDVSWQHAQLFRQSLDSDHCTLQLQADLARNN